LLYLPERKLHQGHLQPRTIRYRLSHLLARYVRQDSEGCGRPENEQEAREEEMTVRQVGGEYWQAIIHTSSGCVRGIAREQAEAIKRCKQLATGRVSR